MRTARSTVVTAALIAVLTPAAAYAAVGAPSKPAAAGDTVTLSVRDALRALPVRAEDTGAYSRSAFKHWTDADKDGCDTRAEVLLEEAVVAPEQGARCKLSGGQWYSAYDGAVVDAPGGLDVDHMVPLGEAWQSGAQEWTAAQREAYANDLDDPRSLIAVTGKSNRSKGKKDPAEWQPPYEDNACQYNANWIIVKTRWSQTVDTAEKDALADKLSNCPNTTFTVTLAR